MEQGIALHNNVNLGLALTPQLLQSVTVLQYNALELEQAITSAIESNPLLEEDESREDTEQDDMTHEEPQEDRTIDMDDRDDFYGTSSAEDWQVSCQPGEYDECPIKDREGTMADLLRDELKLWEPSKSTRDLVASGISIEHILDVVGYVIDSLDPNGYLSADPSLIRMPSDDPDTESVEEFIDGKPFDELTPVAREAILIVRKIGPSGIATRNTRECLAAQAYDQCMSDVVMDILNKHYDLLVAMQYQKLTTALKCDIDDVMAAIDQIAILHPHPGRTMDTSNEPIYPVVRIVPHGKTWKSVAIVSPRNRMRVNQFYAGMASDKSLPSADRAYIKTKLNEARSFMRAVSDRYSTIEKVCNAIIGRQKAYFNGGHLVPMGLVDIASDTGLSVSTISRATSGKYADTPHGSIELGSLFTKAVSGDQSVDRVVERIKEIIDGEDHANPLSDQAITDTLVSEGFQVSRRVVAKYREEQLHILSTRHRRKR